MVDIVAKLEKFVLNLHPEVERLALELAKQELLSVDPGRLFLACDEWFGERAYAAMRAFAARPLSLPVWQVIRRGPAGKNLNLPERTVLVRSPERALAVLLEVFEACGEIPGDILWGDEEIEFLTSTGDVIVSLRHANVPAPDIESRQRIDKILRGVRSGEVHRLAKRLSKFPGLAGITVADELQGTIKGAVVSFAAENLAAALKTMLAEKFDVKVEHHKALYLFARMAGLSSWHEVSSVRDVALIASVPAALFSYSDDSETIELFQSSSDAIAMFAAKCASWPEVCHIRLDQWREKNGRAVPLLRAYSDGSTKARLLAACGPELPVLEGVHPKSIVLARGLLSVPYDVANEAIREHFRSLGARESRLG